MKFKRPESLEKGGMDITPLVDVVFLLLIFFLFTSPLANRHSIKVNLPEVKRSDSVSEDVARITINEFDEIFFRENRVSLAELKQRLEGAENRDRQVLIEGDRNASLGIVVTVWDLCRSAGVKTLNVGTVIRK